MNASAREAIEAVDRLRAADMTKPGAIELAEAAAQALTAFAVELDRAEKSDAIIRAIEVTAEPHDPGEAETGDDDHAP